MLYATTYKSFSRCWNFRRSWTPWRTLGRSNTMVEEEAMILMKARTNNANTVSVYQDVELYSCNVSYGIYILSIIMSYI